MVHFLFTSTLLFTQALESRVRELERKVASLKEEVATLKVGESSQIKTDALTNPFIYNCRWLGISQRRRWHTIFRMASSWKLKIQRGDGPEKTILQRIGGEECDRSTWPCATINWQSFCTMLLWKKKAVYTDKISERLMLVISNSELMNQNPTQTTEGKGHRPKAVT